MTLLVQWFFKVSFKPLLEAKTNIKIESSVGEMETTLTEQE